MGTVNHLYFYVNGMLLMEYRYNAMGDTTDVLQYFYDANGKPHAMAYNGTVYLYVTNLQGDIVALLGLDGTVSGYEYDPYGNVIASYGDIAAINPLRYRGYYYDTETGLYYLQSRYYDPVVGRFINADSYASTGQGIIGYNMFAYCGNNPVNTADYQGEWFVIVIGSATGALVSGVSTAIQGGSRDEIIVSAICGAFSGFVAATGAGGLIGQVAAGAISSVVDSGYQNYNAYAAGELTLEDAASSTLVSATLGAVFGAMGYEGTDALTSSDLVSQNTLDALGTLIKPVVHPRVRSAAEATVRAGRNYIVSTTKIALIDNLLTNAISCGVSEVHSRLH